MELIVGRRGSAPHRPGGSKSTVEGRHAGTAGGPPAACLLHRPTCVPWCLLTCEAEPAWRDCTCGSGSVSAANCQPWVLDVSLDLWTGGNA